MRMRRSSPPTYFEFPPRAAPISPQRSSRRRLWQKLIPQLRIAETGNGRVVLCRGGSWRLRRIDEPVPDMAVGEQILRISRVVFQFLTQLPDKRPQVLHLVGVLRSPHDMQ